MLPIKKKIMYNANVLAKKIYSFTFFSSSIEKIINNSIKYNSIINDQWIVQSTLYSKQTNKTDDNP